MARKRMVSLQIVDTDAFLDMPQSSQLLYFHLIMRADDEGFVDNHKKIMRLIGTQEDDLKVLIAKRFILTFDSGIVVIKHWLIHNTIRMDRFNPTSYLDEKKTLITTKNKAYTENGNQTATTGLHKLSKVNLSKAKKGITSNTEQSSAHGNVLINTLEELLKSFVETTSLDGTIKENRQYAYLLVKNKIKPEYKSRVGREPIDDEVRASFSAILNNADSFHKKNLTNFKYLYYNFAKLIKKSNNLVIAK